MKSLLLKVYYKILDINSYVKYLFQIIYYKLNYKRANPSLNLENINKVVFVAHPDDEILFFSRQLLNDSKILVVCMTNGGNWIRQKEFIELMKAIRLQFKILNFRDGTNAKWNSKKIKREISKIINLKNHWEMIITHNKEGEYGHTQHKLLNKYVEEVCKGKNIYTSSTSEYIECKENALSLMEKNRKIEFMKKYYKSQDNSSKYIMKYYDYEGIIKC